jgi:hypothetical protein
LDLEGLNLFGEVHGRSGHGRSGRELGGVGGGRGLIHLDAVKSERTSSTAVEADILANPGRVIVHI